MQNLTPIRLSVLGALRALLHESATTNDRKPLDLAALSAEMKADIKVIQGTIVELVQLGYAEPTAESHLAALQGLCRITASGLAHLADCESELFMHSIKNPQEPIPVSRPAGFDLSAATTQAS